MTKKQNRNKMVNSLREAGISFKKIAEDLGFTINQCHQFKKDHLQLGLTYRPNSLENIVQRDKENSVAWPKITHDPKVTYPIRRAESFKIKSKFDFNVGQGLVALSTKGSVQQERRPPKVALPIA